jgi:hypothetical protein
VAELGKEFDMNDPTATIQRCTAQRRNGSFCDDPAADFMPFPICAKHALRVAVAVSELAADRRRDSLFMLVKGMEEIQDGRKRATRIAKAQGQTEGLVYYVRLGNHIKIGYTRDIKARLRSYGPTAVLLASEPDPGGVEHERHRQFAEHLAAGNEWFRPAPELMEHISNLTK